jgi:hypothetical protein
MSIYKIISDLGNEVYIGSTTKSLEDRFKKHINYTTDNGRKPTSSIIINKYGASNCRIELIEKVTEGIREREGYWILNTPNCINKVVPKRQKDEYDKMYYEKNKEKLKEQSRIYHKKQYDENREIILEKKRTTKEKCECGSEYMKSNRSFHIKSKKHLKFYET